MPTVPWSSLGLGVGLGLLVGLLALLGSGLGLLGSGSVSWVFDGSSSLVLHPELTPGWLSWLWCDVFFIKLIKFALKWCDFGAGGSFVG